MKLPDIYHDIEDNEINFSSIILKLILILLLLFFQSQFNVSRVVIIIIILFFVFDLFIFLRNVQIKNKLKKEIDQWKGKVEEIRNEESMETNILTNEFIVTASHNFRTPITGLKGYLDLLDKEEVFAQDRKLYISKMKGLVQRLFELVQNMLTIIVKPEKSDLDIVNILQNIVNNISANASMKNMSISFEKPEIPVHVYGDQRLLMIAFENILSNSVKYGFSDSSVSVTLTIESNQVILRFKNIGVGIPVDEIPTLFEKFHRAKNVLMTYEGTGLGLFITKQIVIVHNGNISVTSEENKETCFTINFPLYKQGN